MAEEEISMKKFIVYSSLAIHRAFRFSMFSSTSYYYFLSILDNVENTNHYQGYIASMFSAAGFFSVLCTGFVLEQWKCYKKALVVFSGLSVVGSAIYLIPIPYTPMVGKTLIGLALGHIVAVNSDLSSFKKGNKSSKLLLYINRAAYASSLFGLLLVMFVFPHVDFLIGKWRIWEGNLPIMLVILCNTVCFLLCVFLLPSDNKNDKMVYHSKMGKKFSSVGNKEYWNNVKSLVKNKNYLVLALHSLLLHNARIIHNVYLPVLMYSCYKLPAKYLTVIIFVATVGVNVYLYFLNKLLNYVSPTTIVMVNTSGLLMLELFQCFAHGDLVCDMGLVIYIYITIFIAPCVRVLLVAQVGKVVSKKSIETAQSFFEFLILLGSTGGAALAGKFANHIFPVITLQLVVGCFTLSMLMYRSKAIIEDAS